ncbi:MAG: hypothetical protein JXQ27_19195 [Acidobacteria bacterium]|nr:hypothetical protein [Acidobacteriota bacterium]
MKHSGRCGLVSLVLLLGLTGAWLMAAADDPADEKGLGMRPRGCHWIMGDGSALFNSERGAFEGEAVLTIDGHPVVADVRVMLLGIVREESDMTLVAVTSHEFHFADGAALVTFDDAWLTPTTEEGVYALSVRAVVETGWGDYRLARGRMVLTGEIDLVAGITSWTVTGKICFF